MTKPAKILAVDDEPDFELLLKQRFRQRIRKGDLVIRFAGIKDAALCETGGFAQPRIQGAPQLQAFLNERNFARVPAHLAAPAPIAA